MKVKSLLTIALAALAMNAVAQDKYFVSEEDLVTVDKHLIVAGKNELRLMIVNPNYRMQAIDLKLTVGDVEGLKFVEDDESEEIFVLNSDDFACFGKWTVEAFFQDAEGKTIDADGGAGILAVNYATASSIKKGNGLFDKQTEPVQFASAWLEADPEKLEDGKEYTILLHSVDFASPDADGKSVYPVGMNPELDGDNFGKDATEGYSVLKVKFDATAVNTINSEAAVASVKYFNLAGAESNTAFDGVNLVVTKYTDGTTKTVKVVK